MPGTRGKGNGRPIWSTDAPFRETPSRVRYLRERGALAVDMEAAVIFAVALHRGVKAAYLLLAGYDVQELPRSEALETLRKVIYRS